MEMHIQKCQKCGSRELRNILVRDQSQKVYVQCRQCAQLVARYVLASGGYYHAGKEIESFLRSMEQFGGTSSGRDMQALFSEVKHDADAEFDDLQQQLTERYGDKLP